MTEAAPAENVLDPTIQSIITKARSVRVLAPARGTMITGLITAVLMWACFTPLNWTPLGWICLVPLLMLARIRQKTKWMYSVTYVCGFLWAMCTLQWMRLGHWTMYMALTALSLYVAMYFPVFLAVTRAAVHRWNVPLLIAAPMSWVGLEFVRAHLLTGFSWYYLGHSQWAWTELIQISDITGAYGVSFVVAMVAACCSLFVPAAWFTKLSLFPPGTSASDGLIRHKIQPNVIVSTLVFSAVLGYGFVRRSQADFQPGPRVGLVQGNFTSEVKHDERSRDGILSHHDVLTGVAVREQPNLIVWPESMFPYPLLDAGENKTDEQILAGLAGDPALQTHQEEMLRQWRENPSLQRLTNDARKTNSALMIGAVTRYLTPKDGIKLYNSATFIRPDTGPVDRYDKMHRVIFGEYIPLKETLPFLKHFSPYGESGGIEAGKRPVVVSDGSWNYAPIICFEDTVPQLVRAFAARANSADNAIDCFVNLTNDGWFHGSSELDQHLITATFRCVETRTPMVRAVNTGISAYIDGDGVIREPEYMYDADAGKETTMRDENGNWRKQLNAVTVSTVPLDSRSSLYVRTGDWFAGLCGFFVVFVSLLVLLPRKRAVA